MTKSFLLVYPCLRHDMFRFSEAGTHNLKGNPSYTDKKCD